MRSRTPTTPYRWRPTNDAECTRAWAFLMDYGCSISPDEHVRLLPTPTLCLPLLLGKGWGEGHFTSYCLKKNVSGPEVAGVMPSGLLYCRSGMFPILTLTTRTP